MKRTKRIICKAVKIYEKDNENNRICTAVWIYEKNGKNCKK